MTVAHLIKSFTLWEFVKAHGTFAPSLERSSARTE